MREAAEALRRRVVEGAWRVCWGGVRRGMRREPARDALVVHRGADEEDEEVEAPHHLREPQQREVFADVVVREVAEARHPDVRRDVDPDRVVDLRRLYSTRELGMVGVLGMWAPNVGSRDRLAPRRRTAK